MATRVAQLESVEFWIVTIFLVIVALAALWAAFYVLRRSRTALDTPTARIRSAAQGYVELKGHADLLPGEPITAPLSRKLCVWWHAQVQEHKRRGNESSWETIYDERSDSLFQLIDDTGECIVDPDGAKVVSSVTLRWNGNTPRPTEVPRSSRWIGFGRYRYKEHRIQPADAIYALGFFRTEDPLADAFDEKADVGELLRLWKMDRRKMLEFDANGDGQIDMQEWETVRAAAIAQVRAEQLKRATDTDINVLCRPPDRRPFVISTVPEEKLVLRDRLAAAAGIIGFLAAGAGSVFLLTARGIL